MTQNVQEHGPDPRRAADLAEFIAALDELRLWAGAPSYRSLARKVGPLLRSRQAVSQSTIGDVFQPGRKRLNLDLVVAIVRALGADEATVARWRTACVAAQAGAKNGGPTGVFRQLPRVPPLFTGRERELGEILALAAATTGPASRAYLGAFAAGCTEGGAVAVCAIEGMGGAGKTYLALQAAHRLVRAGKFADVQLYVDLRGFDAERSPAAPADVLDGLLRTLGVPVPHIPDGLGERAAMFRDRLHGKDALILLDNAAHEDQVRDLIPSSPSCLVLITSRRSLAGLDGAALLALDAFAVDDAVDLLAAVAGPARVAAEPAAAARVAALCGGLPLAVALAGARLRTRPAWRLTDLAEHLRSGGLDAVSAGGRALRPVLDLSYAGLPEPARTMFRALGLHTGDDFAPQTAAALAGTDPATAHHLLERLQDEHLVRQRSFGRYSLHGLLRAHARELAHAQPREAEAAVGRLLAFCLHSAHRARALVDPRARPLDLEPPGGDCHPMEFADRDQALRWWEQETPGLLAAARLAADRGRHTAAWQLLVVVSDHLLLQGRADARLGALTAALDSARAAGDAAGETAVLDRLGVTHAGSAAVHRAALAAGPAAG
jgi:hypothetical protein